MLPLLLGRCRSAIRDGARKHSRGRPYRGDRRQRYGHRGADCRRGPRVHHSSTSRRAFDENRQFPGTRAALSRRLVALHGRKHGQNDGGLRQFRQRRRLGGNVVSDGRSARRPAVLPRPERCGTRSISAAHPTLGDG